MAISHTAAGVRWTPAVALPYRMAIQWRESDRKVDFLRTKGTLTVTAPEPLWGLVVNFALNLFSEVGLDGTRYGVLTNPFGCGLIADWLEEHTDQLQPAPEPEMLQAICTELRRGLQ